ncbi:TPA: hypothetical protein ACH3X2_008247 [Trebouxia sp. C0005]
MAAAYARRKEGMWMICGVPMFDHMGDISEDESDTGGSRLHSDILKESTSTMVNSKEKAMAKFRADMTYAAAMSSGKTPDEKSISQAISDQDDSNWIKPEVDPVKEEEDRLRSIERTKAGFKRREAAQSVQEKYRQGHVKSLK